LKTDKKISKTEVFNERLERENKITPLQDVRANHEDINIPKLKKPNASGIQAYLQSCQAKPAR
jgi:hypothetical protein